MQNPPRHKARHSHDHRGEGSAFVCADGVSSNNPVNGYVIVSGWRRRMPHDEIVAALRGAGLTAPVLGAVRDVPEAARGPGGDARRAGVREWLDQRPEVVRWVVVDDHEQHWTERDGGTGWEALPAWLAGRTVHPRDGMAEEDVEAALRALGRPARPDQ